MQEWLWIKASIASWTGLDSGAMHVLASLLLYLGVARLMRRPITSWLPWWAVFLAETANEAATVLVDGVIEGWERVGSLQDLALVMVAPTMLLLAGRHSPELFGVAPTLLTRTWGSPRRRPDVVDAQFEEIPVGGTGSTSA